MSSVDQTITLLPVLPADPIVVCDSPFLSTLAKVEREVAGLAISDAASAQAAANLLQRLTSAGSKLNDVRLQISAPFRAKVDEINNAAKAPAKRIEEAKTLLKNKSARYDQEQRDAAKKAEEARQKELARLEAIKRQEDAEKERQAEETARLLREAQEKSRVPVMDVEFDDEPVPEAKTATEIRIEEVKYAPVVAAVRPVGVAFRSVLMIDTITVSELPDLYIISTANEKLIRATHCTGWKEGDAIPEVPGVTFKVDRVVASTGRAVF